MTTLCYAKRTCAIGIHVIMEEIGSPYELSLIDLATGEQKLPKYKSINPKGKVPALVREDGSILTEFVAISMWLSLNNPDKNLMPTDPERLVRTVEALDFIVGTVHMLSWRMWRRPDAYSDNPSGQELLRIRGKTAMMDALKLVDVQLANKEYLMGDFSIADAALYYTEFWAVDVAGWELPKNVKAHYEKMKTRPSVQASRKLEGLS